MKNNNTKNNDTSAALQPCADDSHDTAPSTILPKRDEAEARVKMLHNQLNKLARKTLPLASEAGKILCELKESTPHGEWESYVENDLGIHPRTASNYMRVWRKTSNLHTLGESLKSESISGMGMRELLDYFAEQEKSSTTKSDDRSPAPKSDASPASQPAVTLALADDSKISLKKIGWQEGLIPKECLETSLSELASQAETPADGKGIALMQRFVAEIVACINRRTGKARHEAATKIAQASLEIVKKMISETNTPPQQG